MIIYTPAPLGRPRHNDWRADPYRCGLTDVAPVCQRPASVQRQFDVATPVVNSDCPF